MSDDLFFVICSLCYSRSPPPHTHCYKYIKSQEHLPFHVWGQHKKKSPLCERVRGSAYEKKGRLRPHLYQSALHLSTGPQWIQPTVHECVWHTAQCKIGVFYREGFTGTFVWRSTAQSAIVPWLFPPRSLLPQPQPVSGMRDTQHHRCR